MPTTLHLPVPCLPCRPDLRKAQRADRAKELLGLAGISADRLAAYPHQLSGGMRQRVMIAMALAPDPEILVMDEPTTALEVVMQRQILRRLVRLREQLNFSVVFITHGISLLIEFSDRIAIMYGGRIVEEAGVAEIYRDPRHPYSDGLLHSFPALHGPRRELTGIPGSPPHLSAMPNGCDFHPRCTQTFAPCATQIPPLAPPAPGPAAEAAVPGEAPTPGRRDLGAALHAVHHLLLGHGLAAGALRDAAGGNPLELGITLNLGTATPETDSEADREACRRADGMGARLYLDPVVHGRYPEDVIADLAAQNIELPVRDGDAAAIATPIDVLSVNFYRGALFSGVTDDGSPIDAEGVPVVRMVDRDRPRTAMGWEINPTELTDPLLRLERDYGLPTVITENGAAFDDTVDPDGSVPDADRTAYLADHIAAVVAARAQGADVRGYFAWSLMGNFEWAYGYAKRFGIVRVDYDTQVRTLKDSAKWYRDTIGLTRAGTA
ncbi:family 1 glycosylhydrolase [Streptomyces sp. WZ.A104]|uniref:family 1 glycosylhydrolase n=1 Tax=Streptomyces sp. WZ.A104 TaxID=2023771 RepID=UPI00211CDCC6|nr:family 1 glycosylhydrolase [Streptomyces sp. WZ.A104]